VGGAAAHHDRLIDPDTFRGGAGLMGGDVGVSAGGGIDTNVKTGAACRAAARAG
jgi:hypothetical protein